MAKRVVVIGAGVGGLVAALLLAARGLDVTVIEKALTPGGKLREVAIGNLRIDSGPTVLTMRPIFEEIFESAGAVLADHLTLRPAEILARHAWAPEERLDLFADPLRSADAIGAFAGAAEARRYLAFCERARVIYGILEGPFIKSPKPHLPALMHRIGLNRPLALWRINPYQSLWSALGAHFRDPRLRQLFGRYSTYCGSSPFLAPATLMLIAHCEREGVWLVEGGMHRIATALAGLAESLGAVFRYGAAVTELLVDGRGASGVRLPDGEVLAADAIVMNADASAMSAGHFGAAARRAAPALKPQARSLSAITWSMAAETEGFPLIRHNVFFPRASNGEFDDIFNHSRLPRSPAVYVCAQDRGGADGPAPGGPERLLCIVNAPATGDTQTFGTTEIEPCEGTTFRLLERCGLKVTLRRESMAVTTPADFERLFPATGGALYGRASHGWMASFRRPGARSRIPRLYLAGGSAHPGAGVPMAAISGRLAAASLLSDLASI